MSKNFQVDFIGVGAARSGTTFLSKCLDEHPDIGMSEIKEVEFFNKTKSVIRENRNDKSWNYPKGLSWYEKQFPDRNKYKIIGEFSVDYLVDKDTPKLIKKHFPDVKIVMCLRNPIERAYSHYWFYKRGSELEKVKSFESAIRKKRGYLKRSLYSEGVERYMKIFGKKNILILYYFQLKQNPQDVVKRLYEFLGVKSDYVPPSLHKKINAAYIHRNKLFADFMYGIVTLLERLKLDVIVTLLKKIKIYYLFRWLHNLINRKDSSYPPMKTKTRNDLKVFFEQDIKRLEKIDNVDLKIWLD